MNAEDLLRVEAEMSGPDIAERNGEAQGLPPWQSAAAFCAEPCPPPPEIIRGVLHQGGKLVYGGPSKARKTWSMLDLGLSVSTGTRWLDFETTASRVLFANFELPPFALHSRLRAIAHAKGVDVPSGDQFVIWNLRGHAAPFSMLLPILCERVKDFGLVILDPTYALLGDLDENSARDMSQLFNQFEQLNTATKASLAMSAHYAKGSASGKEVIDRVSGSGVFARAPDAIITATPLETEDSFAIETILRSFPPRKPFSVRWDYPLLRLADDLDPAALKRPQSRPAKTKLDLLALVPLSEPILKSELLQKAQGTIGEKTARAFIDQLTQDEILHVWKVKRHGTNPLLLLCRQPQPAPTAQPELTK